MNTWEYNVIEKWGAPLMGEELNKYGDDGWELVTVIDAYITMKGITEDAFRYFVFKRPKKSKL